MAQLGFWQTIGESLTGPGKFRLVLQPLAAIVIGVRLGLLDAHEGVPPFVWRMLTDHGERLKLLRSSVSRVLLPLCLAVLIDAALQLWTQHWVRPLAAVVVGAILVWIPFLASRALTNRAFRRVHRREPRRA